MLKPAQLVLLSAVLLCCVELGRPQYYDGKYMYTEGMIVDFKLI